MDKTMATDPRPIEVFFSYSHEDESYVNELRKHLAGLKRKGVVTTWHDRMIGAGREWEGQIDHHLETAEIILLLVSADFIASDYCWDVEVTRAMDRHAKNEALVIPVLLRPVDDFNDKPFGKLQALPTDLQPVSTWPNRDEAFVNIAGGIREAISELSSKKR
jgi:hypothetical protein